MASEDVLIGEMGDESLLSASLTDKKRLEVSFLDGVVSVFPLMMLRDCCLCPSCYCSSSNARLTLFESITGDNSVALSCTLQVIKNQ